MLAGEPQQIMPPSSLAQLHQRQSGQATIRDQRTLRLAQMRQDAIQQGSYDSPLSFLPGLLERHYLPTDWEEPRMHEQSPIHDAGPVIQGRQIEDKGQATISKEEQEVCQEAGPDRRHDNLCIREEAREPTFDTGGFGGTDAQEFLRNHRQASLTGKHEAEDKESERFATMTMHLWQELVDLR